MKFLGIEFQQFGENTNKLLRRIGLVAYLVVLGVIAVNAMAAHLGLVDGSRFSTFFWIAFWSGVAGSLIHSGQSLSSYLGNGTFSKSWSYWYLMRPGIGGLLGLFVYFLIQSNMVESAKSAIGRVGEAEAALTQNFQIGATPEENVSELNPNFIALLAMLAGWFSKKMNDFASDALDAILPTKSDLNRKNKMNEGSVSPEISAISPDPLDGVTELIVSGERFLKGAVVLIDGETFLAEFKSSNQLVVSLIDWSPADDARLAVQVLNPKDTSALSGEFVANRAPNGTATETPEMQTAERIAKEIEGLAGRIASEDPTSAESKKLRDKLKNSVSKLSFPEAIKCIENALTNAVAKHHGNLRVSDACRRIRSELKKESDA